MKKLVLAIAMTMTTTISAVEFKVNSKVEKLSGKFETTEIKRTGNKIEGTIVVKSMKLNAKQDKKEDLMEYFDAADHPKMKFKATKNGGALVGEYILKGKTKQLKGIINGNKATFKVPLTDLVTGFKAMFLGKGDHVELKMEIK